jgi:hypothetical protein
MHAGSFEGRALRLLRHSLPANRRFKRGEFNLKALLDAPGVVYAQAILYAKVSVGP